MPRPCTICANHKRDQIDLELVGGGAVRAIATRYQVSDTSLARHKQNHLSPAIVKVAGERRALEVAAGTYTSILQRLEGLSETIERFIGVAERKGSIVGGAAVIREMRQVLETIAKITGELDEKPQSLTVNILSSPEVVGLLGRLLTALAPYPEARIAAARVIDVDALETAS